MDKFENYIKSYEKKRISFEEIEKYFYSNNVSDYNIIYNKITEKINSGLLKPLKNRINNSRVPPLPSKYEIINKIDLSLLNIYDPGIDISYYKTRVQEFEKDKKIIDIINDFLRKKEILKTTTRERAYELFGDEKALDGPTEYIKVMKRIKVKVETDLLCIRPREPFFMFNFNDRINKKILICENQSPFYDFFLLYKKSIVPFDSVVFGQGKKIISSFDFVNEFFGKNCQYYYWGDIDYEGIKIMTSVIKKYPDYNITPCEKLYRYQIINSKRKKSRQEIPEEFLENYKNNSIITQLLEVIKNNYSIPQEAVNLYTLEKIFEVNDER